MENQLFKVILFFEGSCRKDSPEKGIDTITSAGEDPKFFIIPDIGIEINAIENSNKSLEDITKSKDKIIQEVKNQSGQDPLNFPMV